MSFPISMGPGIMVNWVGSGWGGGARLIFNSFLSIMRHRANIKVGGAAAEVRGTAAPSAPPPTLSASLPISWLHINYYRTSVTSLKLHERRHRGGGGGGMVPQHLCQAKITPLGAA